jgi:isopentenyl diphosphate isomerase/L-lactate dehydrogenase-like FMN-dependent dehydrogenase
MSAQTEREQQRRLLLKWLSASPLLTLPGSLQVFAEDYAKRPDPMVWPATVTDLIANAKDAVNVFDFEPVAYKNVPPAHFGYMASGIDDEVTLRANRQAFLKFQLRPRRLRDVSKVDMSVNLFGTRWETPIIMGPTGANRAYHPDGELGVARAARAKGHLNVLASAAGTSIEDAMAARQDVVWFQLYATASLEVAKQAARRVERAGCPVMEITVDRNGGRNQETYFRMRRLDTRTCAACHPMGPGAAVARPIYDGIDMSKVSLLSSNMTWDFIKSMRDTTKMKLIVKGILTAEDAELCLKYGVDAIHVSNHGGRSEDNGRGSIECLPEVARVAKGKVPILFDSGVRRGTDILKALAMGASAVCIGRPYLWGLGAFGQPGVERVLEILREELTAIMQQVGAPTVADIVPEMVLKV